MEGDEALIATQAVARALEELEIDFVVAGSLASSFHGIPRSTLDADLVVDLRAADVGPLADLLAADFYIDPERAREAVTAARVASRASDRNRDRDRARVACAGPCGS